MYVKDKDKEKKKDSSAGGKRVYKDKADKKLQEKMEGKDTPFQRALRKAESEGKKTFKYNGKLYAARTKPPKPKGETKKVSSKAPNVKVKTSDLPKPQKVATPKAEGNRKVLAKDITGNPLYKRGRRKASKNIAKMLRKRKKRRTN